MVTQIQGIVENITAAEKECCREMYECDVVANLSILCDGECLINKYGSFCAMMCLFDSFVHCGKD